jgi:hypothetical protein
MSKLLSYRPPRIAAALLAVSIGLWYFSPTYTLLYMPYQLVASICIIVGFTVMLFAWLQFKKSDAAVCPTAKTSCEKRGQIYFLYVQSRSKNCEGKINLSPFSSEAFNRLPPGANL